LTKPKDSEVADILHDMMLRTLARLAPIGGDSTVSVDAVCDGLIRLMAELLIATRPAVLSAAEIEIEAARLTDLFRLRLSEALAERADRSGPVGHA
jgi:hypothetical protein